MEIVVVFLSISLLSILKTTIQDKRVGATIFLPNSAMREDGLLTYHIDGLEIWIMYLALIFHLERSL